MKKPIISITLGADTLDLRAAETIAKGSDLQLGKDIKSHMDDSHKLVKEVADGSKLVYGINTGFGYLAHQHITKLNQKKLQKNIIVSHAAGSGSLLSVPEIRLAMALRIHVLAKGFTGVRYKLCQSLLDLIHAEIYPTIPEMGSVGASGDLIPLAHLALPLLGLGNVHYRGDIIPAIKALKKARLKPISLAEKEGLSLVNGTQIMLSVGGLALATACKILNLSDIIAATSFEGLVGQIDALNPLLHEVRGQIGQIQSAKNILEALEGSYLFDPRTKRKKVQDPYSLRCTPQVHGPSRDAITYSKQIVEKELNAVTDNPLVFASEGSIISGGNFHGQALAFAFDIAAMALAELCNISERRLEVLMNPHLSNLPPFLSPDPGLNSGYMALQYLSGSLVNENKLLANPACTDSIPANVGIEDHVSMGMTSARKLKKIVENTQTVLAVEMLSAVQAIDLRKVEKRLGQKTKKIYKIVRKTIPPLKNDRFIHHDVKQALSLIEVLLGDPYEDS